MNINSLPEFLKKLEEAGLLKKISAEVDPVHEVSEIASRLYAASALPPCPPVPVLYFEKVKGSKMPLVVNLLGNPKALELLLGKDPETLMEKAVSILKEAPQAFSAGKMLPWLWDQRPWVKRMFSARTVRFPTAPAKEIKKTGEAIDLAEFPILKCWPEDGGKFITAGLVITKSPKTGIRNMGIYRLQVLSRNELIIHAQIQKGGGFHYAESESMDEPLEVAVVIGADPWLWLGGAFPLPEGMDELSLVGFLKNEAVPVVECETLDLEVPASAEVIIEAVARPRRRALEGPFGDHFGHYSHPSDFPVLEIQCVTHKKNPVFQAAVVGKPPQEDRAMGETVARILTPLIKLTRPEVEDLWAYHEAGFHNLLAVSVRQRYGKEGVKAALGILGEGQLSLAKCIILVDPDVDVKDFKAVLRAVRENFEPEKDFILLPKTPQDTLDFTGARLNEGSKMILDATRGKESKRKDGSALNIEDVRKMDGDILDAKVLEDTLLVVKVKGGGQALLSRLLRKPGLQFLKMIALVSDDVALDNDTLLLWGIFTRFDCARDCLFAETRLEGIAPVSSGPLGIDATWKNHYPLPVLMDPETAKRVSARWKELGF